MISHHRGAVRPDPVGAEAGMSLTEILAAVVIMGLVFTAVLTGIFTVIKITDDNSRRATADRLARGLAEEVKTGAQGSPYSYVPCAAAGSYPYTPPPPYQEWRVKVAKIEYWDGQNPAGWTPTCTGRDTDGNPTTIEDWGAQKFTIEARPPVGATSQIVQTVTVVKRDPKMDVN